MIRNAALNWGKSVDSHACHISGFARCYIKMQIRKH